MKFLKGLDMRRVSINVARGGGQTLGYGWLIGKRTFFGVVRTTPRMRPVRMKHLRKEKA